MKKLAALCLPTLCALAIAAPAAAHPRPLPALAPAPHDALFRALEHGRLTEPEYALERARSLFHLRTVRREFGDVARPNPLAATLILRDLVMRVRRLAPDEQRAAHALLSRPTDATFRDEHHYTAPRSDWRSACDASRPLCYHWVVSTPDAPPLTDTSPANGIPDTVDQTMATFASVWDLEVVDYGFQAPLPDTTSRNDEGSSDTDIYLADLGGDKVKLFGYCTTDDPHFISRSSTYPYYDASAYCVVDDDFSQAQFGTSQTPQEFRDVTAAHEFFHAIQFHYDVAEDLWLMEGTAMVMEGQFRPDVKDRIRYLDDSTLTSPPTPVDLGAGGFEYGAWIFWRFLIEDRGELADPLVIRQVWEAADGSSDEDGPGPDAIGPDAYSLLAVRRVLAARGLSFRQVFAHFAWVNRVPGSFYAEGAEYPAARAAARYALGPSRHSTGWLSYRIKHLAQRYVVLKPRLTAPPDMHVRVRVDLPNLGSGPVANLLIHYVGGGLSLRPISLDSTGRGSRVVPLGRGAVRRVDLILTNASARFHCWQGTNYSCAGLPVDDLRTYRFVATVL